MSEIVLPMFSSRIFMVWGLTLKSLIHFEFILVCGVRRWSSFIYLHISVQFSYHYLLIKLFLAHCMWLLPLSNIDYKGVGLLLGSLFCSIDLYVCSYASTRLFWLQRPCSIVWRHVLWLLQLFFFLKIAAVIRGHLWFLIKFWNVCSVSVKCHWYFNKHCVESVGCCA